MYGNEDDKTCQKRQIEISENGDEMVWKGVVIILDSVQKGYPFSKVFVLKQNIILQIVCLVFHEYIKSQSH